MASQVYKDGFLQPTSLAELGLVVQLNHRQGVCPRAAMQTRGFTVYHSNGAHQVNLAYCACEPHLAQNSRVGQIMRNRWLPATGKQPRTAFTFKCLNSFHLLNLQSKCNLYDYYCALICLTNNGDTKDLPVGDLTYLDRSMALMFCPESL
jgi:hypothetical protein